MSKHLVGIRFLISILALVSYTTGFAQGHKEVYNDAPEEHGFKHHRLSVIIGHGHVIGAESSDGNNLITIPTWGFDYSYWINKNIGVGLKSDLEVMNYVVEDRHQTKIERENPIIVSLVFLYHTRKGWNFLTGPGIEFEKNHNLFVYRLGASYEFEFGKHWDFAPEVLFDVKDGSIGSFTWGIGVGKKF